MAILTNEHATAISPPFRASSSSKSCDHNPGNVDEHYTWYYDSGHLLLGMNVCQHSSHRLFLGLKKGEFTTIQAIFNRGASGAGNRLWNRINLAKSLSCEDSGQRQLSI